MVMEVFWTRFAEQKLNELFYYLSFEFSEKSARKSIEEIIKSSMFLSSNPKLGNPIKIEIKTRFQLRSLIIKNQRLIYQINTEKNQVEILHLFDTRQNPEILKNQL